MKKYFQKPFITSWATMSDKNTLKNARKYFAFLKIFGFAPFTISVDGKCVTKPTDALSLLFSFSTGCALIYMFFQFKSVVMQDTIVDTGNFATYVASIVISLLAMIVVFFCRHRIWGIIERFIEADKLFNKAGLYQDYTRYGNITMAVYMFLLFLLVVMTIVVYLLNGSLLKAGLVLYSGVNYVISAGTVTAFVSAIHLRLESMNKLCTSMMTTSYGDSRVKQVKSFSAKTENIEIIRTLIDVYAKLIEVQDSLNLCYGIQTMFSFGLLFFFTIFSCYMAFISVTIDGTLHGSNCAALLVTLYLTLLSLSIIVFCNKTENEAQRVLKLSNEISKKSTDEVEVAMLMSLDSLIKRNPLRFTCGLFDFNWDLIYGVSVLGPVLGFRVKLSHFH